MQLLFCFVNSFPVLTVDDENEALRSGIVVSPQRSNLVLATDIPDIEFYVLIRYGLHVEADCGTKHVLDSRGFYVP